MNKFGVQRKGVTYLSESIKYASTVIVAGIDSCPAGWLMVKNTGDKFAAQVYETFGEIIYANSNLDRIFIDIPVGLSSKNHIRTLDTTLRAQLKKRGSTVFNAPSRPAVYEEDNNKARRANILIEGKSLSIQSLNIRAKIREVDMFLIDKPNYREIVFESHPEFCFKQLNKSVLLTSKSKEEGIEERLNILKRYNSQLEDLFNNVLKSTKRSRVRKDDILDAMCLCLTNLIAVENGISLLQDENKIDEKGIPLRIAF